MEVRFSLLGGPVSMRLLPKKAVSKPVRASESADQGGSASSSERYEGTRLCEGTNRCCGG